MKYQDVINDWYTKFDEAVVPQPNSVATVAQLVSDPQMQQLPNNSPLKKTAKNVSAVIDTKLKQSASLVNNSLTKLNARLAQIAQNSGRITPTL